MTITKVPASLIAGGGGGFGMLRGMVPARHYSTPSTALLISPGTAPDSEGRGAITIASGMAKTTAAWSAGNGGGALDQGAIAANKGYFIHAISGEDGVGDLLFSLSPFAPVLPAGYTWSAIVHSFYTDGSGGIKAGAWYEDGRFSLSDAVVVLNSVSGQYVELAALPVPVGVKLEVEGTVFCSDSAGVAEMYAIVRDPDIGVPADVPEQRFWASVYLPPILGGPGGASYSAGVPFRARTDNSGQVYYYSSNRASTSRVSMYFNSWRIPRGLI